MASKFSEYIQRKDNSVEVNLCDKSLKFSKWKRGLIVMRDEQYDSELYIDSGCIRHMTGKKEELRDFRSLKYGGRVKFGNKATGEIKGSGIITNVEFSIRKVAYVEGLQHNLISISQLVVGTGLKVSFDEEGSEIIEKKTKAVLLKSKRKYKSEATQKLINFSNQIELQLRKHVRKIRSENGLEFKNHTVEELLTGKGISHNFSSPYTPQ
ncbi:uncharacterized protein LOC111913614 [Lactuca sativa]|uniref:uncharacterized protein LOC111913614 n=1 Tax=Lactuca sativa TaxID=4236 RepID=UPI000CD9AD6A|nr:uncharacterized protein LOC111913614 [Lactuca sativa]